ncbi:MAG: FAD-dependent oxidoreductase [Candidatus Omnitrophica bacterium]|nr:FAD-dependent oxidoreductase [Candidatus Omnitrophota bacterium]
MNIFKAKFKEQVKRGETAASFRFIPEQKPDFIPGQFLQVLFDPAHSGNKLLNKYLSFSASPQRDYLEFTKRLSGSDFSAKLKALQPGDEVWLKGPLGNCVFRAEQQKIGFLIGGIGITPVISILEYIADRKLETDIVLLYSNRAEEEIAFRPEIDQWRKENPNLKVCYTLTECQSKDAECLSGYIDEQTLAARMPDAQDRTIFIFGPPGMVKAMLEVCPKNVPREQIKTENFLGY